MDKQLYCPACRCRHLEPAEAVLGHRALCLDCALAADVYFVEGRTSPDDADAGAGETLVAA